MTVELTETTIYCPYCGEPIQILLDPSDVGDEYIEDCQVCCRPIVMSVWEDTDGLGVAVRAEGD